MYIHLGQDTVLNTADVVGIFDLDNATVSKRTRDFLARCEKNGEVINVSYELPKSFVVCVPPGKKSRNIYISQISSTTLAKRSEYLENLCY